MLKLLYLGSKGQIISGLALHHRGLPMRFRLSSNRKQILFFRSPKLELLLAVFFFFPPPRPWRINGRPSQPRVSSDLSAWTLYTCPLESAIRLRHPMAFSSVLLTSYSRSDSTSVSHGSLEHPGVLPTLLFCRLLIGQQHVDDITLKNTV